ncbi:MAG: hypothetical protein JWQ90_321 [Hydrocarboniphaga sp.]|uniref:nuclear transport factor 2 family protein n=1 Tax=Hydrocarboniphaga sp. TaxID=2033016 RepID=UPI00262FA255|nr:nuclear transport factor 2 family protein [Hydrocarboniphaga sp.]MDB5967871.1 hypothetical protein [Hydrocarboniphaga sp.]
MDRNEVEDVKDLILRYADMINLYDLEGFADTFAEHGIWDVTGYFKAIGRQEVRDAFSQQRNAFDWVLQVVHGTRVLALDNSVAKARSYIAEQGNRNGGGYYLLGVYHDECVKDDKVWRFSSRTFHPLYLGPPDLSAPLKHYPAPRLF